MSSTRSVTYCYAAPPGWRRRIKSLVAPLLLNRYDAALTMGDRGENQLALGSASREGVFRMPVMIDEALAGARGARELRDEKRAALGIAPDACVVLAASKLSPRKRIGDFVARARLAQFRLGSPRGGGGRRRRRLEAEAAGLAIRFRLLAVLYGLLVQLRIANGSSLRDSFFNNNIASKYLESKRL